MILLRLVLLCLLALIIPAAAHAQRIGDHPFSQTEATNGPSERIAVVVNDNIISTLDVRARLALALLASDLPNTPEVKQKLMPQVVRNLIDEQLQLQEGKRIDVSVSEEEIKRALDRMAQQNNVPGGDMLAFLQAHNVPPMTLKLQAKATLTWSKVVARTLRPRVDVGDDEVQAAIDRIHENAGKQEYLVSEIFLSVDNPKDEDQVKSFAEQIVARIRSGGSFGAMARQFSQGTGAANGGDIGWIQDGQLPQELNKALMSAKTGEILGPVRSTNGFHILGVREQRLVAAADPKETTLNLQQIFMSFPAGSDKESYSGEVDRATKHLNGCKNLENTIKRDYPSWRWMDLGQIKLADAPVWIADKTKGLSVGKPSEPMISDKGALVLFVCNRDAKTNINREEILNVIGTERLEMLARRQMRDLRRAAYIDVRLNSAP